MPRNALSASPAHQETQYEMQVSLEPGRPCPEELAVLSVDVYSNPEEFDYEHPERNGPVAAFVGGTVKQGAFVGSNTGMTDVFGKAKFGYQAPKRSKIAGMEQLDVVASWIEPWSGREVTLQKTSLHPFAQCSYIIWITGGSTYKPFIKTWLLGLGRAQLKDDFRLAGKGSLSHGSDVIEPNFVKYCREGTQGEGPFTIEGEVSGGIAKIELKFEQMTSQPRAECTLRGFTEQIPLPSGSSDFNTVPGLTRFDVDAFKGGKKSLPVPPPSEGRISILVDVIR
jgi:hypothetical protein